MRAIVSYSQLRSLQDGGYEHHVLSVVQDGYYLVMVCQLGLAAIES